MTISKKPTLGVCVFLSLLAHALFLAFIQTHSLWFYSAVATGRAKPSRTVQTISRDQILKETFATLASPAEAVFEPQKQQACSHLLQAIREKPLKETLAPWHPESPLFSISAETLLSKLDPTYSLPKIEFRTPNTHFLKGLILPPLELLPATPQKPLEIVLKSEQLGSPTLESIKQSQILDPSIDALSFLEEKTAFIPQEPEPLSTHLASFIPLPDLPHFLSLAELDTINLSDAFNAELTFFPKPEGSGYLFSLTLLPREDLQLPPMQQRLVFLIDKSNSIQRERLLATKQAVLRALEDLNEDDTFNIIAFDSKTEKLFPSFSEATPSALSKAEAFLDQITLGSFFTTSDLYRPLLQTIPGHVEDDEIYTAILLTDGETLSSKALRDGLILDWTLQNQGKVSLYIVGMETDPHAEALSTFCTINRGKYIQSSSQRGLKRQILKLAKNIKTPLAKNLSSKMICRTSDRRIDIYPQTAIAPHMYLGQPYVIVGSTDTLDDFFVFIQGRLKDQWLNIKKNISFVNAKKGNLSLKTAFQQYEQLTPHSLQ